MAKAKEKETQLEAKKQEISLSDRFTNSVIASYADVAKGLEITEKERGLIAGYFIELDKALRNSKQGYNWGMVRMKELALDLARTAQLGLDMTIDNMLSFIPFKYKDTGTITLTPVIGKKGYEYIAKTFGLEPPEGAVVELVHNNDEFTMVKRDATHDHDDYTFTVTNPFNRGEVVGAFGYLYYADKRKNLIMVKTKQELLTYRPQYFDKTFWTSQNELKMLEKTMAKQLFKKVTLDPNKVHRYKEAFDRIDAAEIEVADYTAREETAEKMGTGDFIDFVDDSIPSETTDDKETTTYNVDEHGEVTNLFGENE